VAKSERQKNSHQACGDGSVSTEDIDHFQAVQADKPRSCRNRGVSFASRLMSGLANRALVDEEARTGLSDDQKDG